MRLLTPRPDDVNSQLKSFLFLGDRHVDLLPVEHRRVGAYQVCWDATDPLAPNSRYPVEVLGNALQRLRATGLNTRVPIIAPVHGATPSTLSEMLGAQTISHVVPAVDGTARDLEAVYAARSTDGKLRFEVTLERVLGGSAAVRIMFLDPAQLSRIRTGTNHHLVALGSDSPVTAESGHAFVDCWCVLPIGRVLRLPDDSSQTADPATALSLAEVERLVGALRADSSPDDWLTDNSAMSTAGAQLDSDAEPRPYAKMITASRRTSDSFTVQPNVGGPDRIARPAGDFAIAVSAEVRERLDLGRYTALAAGTGTSPLTVLAATLVDDTAGAGVVFADETLRDAIGVAVGDEVRLHRVSGSTRRSIVDRILPRRYLLVRTQVSDFTAFETATCSLPQYAMDILGIAQGDRVVLEAASPEGIVSELRLRAFATPEFREAEYRNYLEPHLDARFPDASAILGVLPDLPPIFVDSEARGNLGLAKCAAIRVRGSRRDQWSKELREIALVLLLAVIGAISLLEPGTVSLWRLHLPIGPLIFVAGALAAVSLLFIGIRRRMR